MAKAQSSAADISTEELSSALREELEALREDFMNLKSELSEKGGKTLRGLREEAQKQGAIAIDSSRECIRENPIMCLCMALGAGIVIGNLLTRD